MTSELDHQTFGQKLRAAQIKSRLRTIILSKVQAFSARAERLIQST
jgi:hypothetical protein